MHRIMFLGVVAAGLLPTAACAGGGMSARDLLSVRWVRQVDVSPTSGDIVFSLRSADPSGNRWRSHLYVVPARATSTPRRVEAFDSDTWPAYSPDGNQIAFASRRGGTSQIYLVPSGGGAVRQLTRMAGGATRPVWSPDGKWIAFAAKVFPDCKDEGCNARRLAARSRKKVKARIFDRLLFRHWNRWRHERRSHVFVVPRSGGSPRDLTPGPHDAPPIALSGNPGYAFSPDGKKLAFVSKTAAVGATSTNNDVFEVALEGGRPVRLSTGKGNDHSPAYSPDGRFLAYLSMRRAGYEADRQRILVRDRSSGKETEWTRGWAGQPGKFVWAPDSKTIFFSARDKGFQNLFSVSGSADVRAVTQKAHASWLRVAADGRSLVFTHTRADRPPEIFRADVAGARLQPITRFNESLASRAGWLPAEHRWYQGAGGDRIHGVLVKPPGFDPAKRYPAVLIVHGGPQGMTADSFHPRWNLQMFAGAGYVVFGINFHGSTGFGQPFTDSIRADWGGKPYRDVVAALAYLRKLPFVDAARICAAGGSYGGYMANWIAVHPKQLSCLVSHAGIYNLPSFYASTEELWFPEWDMKGTPWTSPGVYRRHSPHHRAKHLATPTLVIHGQLDYRVPVEQGFQMFTSLQRQGVPSRLLYFPDEDHWIDKPLNIELWWNTVHEWLGRYLRAGK